MVSRRYIVWMIWGAIGPAMWHWWVPEPIAQPYHPTPPPTHLPISLYVQLVIFKNLLKIQQIQSAVSYVFVHWKIMIATSPVQHFGTKLELTKEKVGWIE